MPIQQPEADRNPDSRGERAGQPDDWIAYHVRHPTSPKWTFDYRAAYYEATGVPLRDADDSQPAEDRICAFFPRDGEEAE